MIKSFSLVKDKIKAVKTTAKQYHQQGIRKYFGSKGIYSNPVQGSCPAKYIFEAIYELGENTWHHIDAVVEKTIAIMSSVSSVDELSQWDAHCIRITKCDIDPHTRLKTAVWLLVYIDEQWMDILVENIN